MHFAVRLLTTGMILGCVSMFAQATGTIHGTVTDASGARVPDATVRLTNTQTNFTRVVTPGPTGEYMAPLLPLGTYTVRFQKEGFNPYEQTHVILQVNTTVQVDARLQVKGPVETVTVSDRATLVQATASNLVQIVDQRRIVDLPLNGRNVLQLMVLGAGISNRGSQGSTVQTDTYGGGSYHVSVSVNGSRGNGVNFLMDNADNNDVYSNVSSPYPNPDAVQEFSIQSSSFDAQYGRSVGGVVNVVTRGGTNELHGSVYEFLRNFNMNAANFFSGRDTLKRNQFGFSLGGPLVLGRWYNGRNKVFFFGSYQGTRQTSATPGALRTAPSDAMKRGDFSAFIKPGGVGLLRDPDASGTYFPNNQVPASRFDPVSVKLLKYMPSSSDPAYQLRFGTPPNTVNDDQVMTRFDYLVSEKQRISARYFLMHYDQPWSFLPDNLLYVNAGQYGNAQHATLNHSYTKSARVLNELTAAFHRSSSIVTPPRGLDISLQTLGARVKVPPEAPNLNIAISGWSGISTSFPWHEPQTNWSVADTFSYANGKHNLRAGFEYRQYKMYVDNYNLTAPAVSFSGQLVADPGKQNSGAAFTEFVLGEVATMRQRSYIDWTVKNKYPSLFVQDDLAVTSRLTLNLGLRWDPAYFFGDTGNRGTTFIPGVQSSVFPKAPKGLLFIGDNGVVENSIVGPDTNNFAPRVGFAYLPFPKTVIRSGYGVFYDQYPAMARNRSLVSEPYLRQFVLTYPEGGLSNPYAGQEPLDPKAVRAGKDFEFTPYGTWSLPSPNLVAGYMQNWNFVIERQFGGNSLLRLAYVGSKGTKLLNTVEQNPGIYRSGATASNVNARRPYQPIGSLPLGLPNGLSNYNSLQVTFNRRFSRGLTLLMNYTRSKSIDITSFASIANNQGGPSPFNLKDNRGVSDFDLPNRLVVSGIWEMPAFRNRHRLWRQTLGEWQGNFIFSAMSGQPITILSGVDNALMGVGGNFADLTGTPWGLPGGRTRADQIKQWFNTQAFTTNAIGTIGTGRRNQLRGPANWNVDFSLFKNFSLMERVKLQVRGEAFNLLNHANIGNPNGTVTSSTFGRITDAGSPRIMQVAARITF